MSPTDIWKTNRNMQVGEINGQQDVVNWHTIPTCSQSYNDVQ